MIAATTTTHERANIQVDEHTTLFTKREKKTYSTAQLITNLVIAGGLVAVLVTAIEKRSNGYVVIPLTVAGGGLVWGAVRANTTLTQREVIRVALTLPIYPLFVSALQWVNDEEASKWSLAAMCAVYLIYGFALAGFFDRSIERTIERIKHPPSGNVKRGESRYECLPHRKTYAYWLGLKGGGGVVLVANSRWAPAPYNLIPLMLGGFYLGTSVGEFASKLFADRLDQSIQNTQSAPLEEGVGEVITYTTAQRTGVGVQEICGNFGLFAGTIGSGLALRFEEYYLLSAITILIGMHQFYTKRELFRQRHLELSPQENSRVVRRFLLSWGITLAVLVGGGLTAYGIYQSVKDDDRVYDGAAGAMIGTWGLTFVAALVVSHLWKKESGVTLSTLHEFLVDNPVILAFLTVYLNHVAVNGKLNQIGADVLGIMGLAVASASLASDNGRALNKRVTLGIPRISPAAAVALTHYVFFFMKIYSTKFERN